MDEFGVPPRPLAVYGSHAIFGFTDPEAPAGVGTIKLLLRRHLISLGQQPSAGPPKRLQILDLGCSNQLIVHRLALRVALAEVMQRLGQHPRMTGRQTPGSQRLLRARTISQTPSGLTILFDLRRRQTGDVTSTSACLTQPLLPSPWPCRADGALFKLTSNPGPQPTQLVDGLLQLTERPPKVFFVRHADIQFKHARHRST